MKRWSLTAFAIATALALMACGGGNDGAAGEGRTPQTGAANGQAVIGSSQEPGHLNPLLILPHHFPVHAPYTLLFDSLVQIAPDGTFQPRLAETWAIADDSLSVTFTLHSTARFHNGERVTATDVVFSFEKMMDPDLATAKDGTANIDRVVAVDELTVRFDLKQPDPRFMPVAGSRGIVPKSLLEGRDVERDDFVRHPVGSGPFKFASWRPGSEIVMEANADYHLGAPGLRRVVFRIVPDQNALVAQLRAGDLDYALVDPRDYPVVSRFEHAKVVENPSPRFYSLGLNLREPVFQDRAVREALIRATPREDLVQNVLEGRGTIIHTNTTPASWAHNPDVVKYEYDVEQARRVLTDAGWTRGSDGIMTRNGQKLSFTVTYIVTERQTEQALVILQQRYRQAGIDIQLEGVEGGELLGRRWPQGDFQVSFQLWNPVYDPDQSSAFRTGGGYNGTGYTNPEVDALFDQALGTFDIDARKRYYGEIQEILARDLPMIWLYSNNEVNVTSNRLQGFAAHPINNFWNIREWTVR